MAALRVHRVDKHSLTGRAAGLWPLAGIWLRPCCAAGIGTQVLHHATPTQLSPRRWTMAVDRRMAAALLRRRRLYPSGAAFRQANAALLLFVMRTS
jgi:hypothetical protein